jgi:hypothetical protein
MKPIRQGVIIYPPFIDEVAACMSKLRDIVNFKLDQDVERYRRDKDVNFIGIKGELIFSHYLTTQGIAHEVNRILDARPVVDWDIKLNSKTIDVKTLTNEDHATALLVNREAYHKQGKKVDYYVFIRLLNGSLEAEFFMFPSSAVRQWKVKSLKYSDAYFLNLSEFY